jgi:heme-binding NEAT domain protein
MGSTEVGTIERTGDAYEDDLRTTHYMVAMQGSFSNPNMVSSALDINICTTRKYVNDTEPNSDAYEQERISHREMEFKRCE